MVDDICGYCGEEGDGDTCTVCQEEMFVRERAIRALLDWYHASRCTPWSRLHPAACACDEAEQEYRSQTTQQVLYAAEYIRRFA